MVLESLITAKKAEKKPWDLFFLGALYASIAMFLSVWIFKEEASIVMVLLTVIAALPLVYNTIKYEEAKDVSSSKESTLMKEHGKALSCFVFLFIGFVFAFSLWFVFLPNEMVGTIFDTQLNTIKSINTQIAGNIVGTSSVDTSAVSGGNLFLQILSNNIRVLLFCLFFAFFYGAGALFILVWNASVISAAVGTFFRNNISRYAEAVGWTKIGGYFHIFSLSLLRYFIHGIPEILAYFIGGLAGGIISVAVIRHDFGTKTFKRIIFDSLDLVMLAIFVLVISAFLEVYVTPAFF